MNINGKIRIRNKWDEVKKVFIKDEFEYEIRTSRAGKDYGYGKLSWSDKDLEGKFKTSSMRFVVYSDAVQIISNGISGLFNIEGKITIESFKGRDGGNISYPQIAIFKAESLETKSSSGGAYVQEQEIKEPDELDMGDDIPF